MSRWGNRYRVDLEKLKEHSLFGYFQSKNGNTKYGCLNVPTFPVESTVAYDFSKDRNGDFSVNCRRTARDLSRKNLTWMADFRGFIICGKTGRCRSLKSSKANHWERKNPRKAENWSDYAMFLIDYLEELE